MSSESRRLAGILLILLPTVIFGGASILALLINHPAYVQNALRQDLCAPVTPTPGSCCCSR
jgi:hypothetical protein